MLLRYRKLEAAFDQQRHDEHDSLYSGVAISRMVSGRWLKLFKGPRTSQDLLRCRWHDLIRGGQICASTLASEEAKVWLTRADAGACSG